MKKWETALVEINQSCNLNCNYCFYQDKGRIDKELNFTRLEKLLEEETKKVYLTGGEPFLNQEIFNILNGLKRKNISIGLFTNGLELRKLKLEKLEETLKLLDNLIISFDSFNKNYNLRGNNSEKLIEIINKIVDYDSKKLEVKICISKYNIDEFEDIIEKLKLIGVKKLSINLVHNIRESNLDFEVTDKKELLKVFEIVEKNIENFDKKYVEAQKIYLNNKSNEISYSCQAGKGFYFIDCEGNKDICPVPLKNKGGEGKACFTSTCVNLWEVF